MATIVGTEAADILQGTNLDPLSPGDDTITALGGDDLILATTGIDNIDGGDGYDTIDFSGITDRDLILTGSGSRVVDLLARGIPPKLDSRLSSVEKIIGNPNRSNTIVDTNSLLSAGSIDVDLAANRLTCYADFALTTPVRTVTIENFDNVRLLFGNNRIAGNDRDNSISGSLISNPNVSKNFIIGSKGNDSLYGGGANNDTLDYSNFGQTVQLLIDSPKTTIFNRANFATVDKGTFGLDSIDSFERIIGTTNKDNTIDASAINTIYGIDLNLTTNSLTTTRVFTSPFSTTIEASNTEVVNFVNAIGTKNNDTIVGSNKNSKLTGGGGNDTITGGTKNDRLTGTDSTARGVGEVDTLTGGSGRDKFVLGDLNGAYYLGNGSNDYATITDFSIFKDSLDLGGLRDYSFAIGSTGTVDLFAGKDVNTRDLVAKIKIADFDLNSLSKGAGSNEKSLSMASMLSGAGIDSIASKIDIISSVNATNDAVI
jgi:Ca2+-binding RTX toxin-like protein